MRKKMLKTTIVILICLAVSIPSNAAVSVSDGSAFVTSAEFSADLNNLTNRMASLENSLEAKIDSLVSSYLTRNGIWNGAKQDLINSDSGWTGFWNGSGTVRLDAFRYHPIDGGDEGFIDASTTYASIETYNQYDSSNKRSICQFNKTGMACVQYDVNSAAATQVSGVGRWSARVCGSISLNYYCLCGATATTIIQLGTGTEVKLNVMDSISFTGSTALKFKSSSNNYGYFFVNKGDVLQAWAASKWEGSGAYGFWNDDHVPHCEGWLSRVWIKDISVF